MALRSIWNGTIAFAGVFVPIKVHAATEDQTVHFHEVHVDDGARIEHKRICPKEDKEVPYREVVKGYEVSEGRYVVLEDEELKAAAGEASRVIEVEEFVCAGEIDPKYEDCHRQAPAEDRRPEAQGKKIAVPENDDAPPDAPPDLMAVLKEALGGGDEVSAPAAHRIQL